MQQQRTTPSLLCTAACDVQDMDQGLYLHVVAHKNAQRIAAYCAVERCKDTTT